MQIYSKYNPSKCGDVDSLLAKYRGRERTLYLGICEKYKVPPTGIGQPPGGAPPPPPPPPPAGSPDQPPQPGGGAAAAVDEETVAKYKELMIEIYKEHNPSKVDDVDNLLTKYRGREELVYRGICEKYKVQPKIPLKKSDEAEAPKSGVEKYKPLISEIYEKHNKEKLGEIDDILAKYKGKEKTLYLAVCHKYNIEPKVPAKKDKGDKDKKGADDEAQKAEEERIAKVKPLIREVYAEHNPAKLEDVDQLLSKYKGREEQLYFGVCEKYGVEPKIPKPAPAEPPAADAAGPPDNAGATAAAEPPSSAAPTSTALVPAAPQQGAASQVGLRQVYCDLIRDVYKEHNPAKLDSVDGLLDKYLGQERDLYQLICKKYDVKPQDPEGLGDLDWLTNAEEKLSSLLEGLISTVVMHSSGLTAEDAEQMAAWDRVRPRPPPCTRKHQFELKHLASAQLDALSKSLQGQEGARWRKLQGKCAGAEVKEPQRGAPLTVVSDGGGPKGRCPFDAAVSQLTAALSTAVRDCMDSDDEGTTQQRFEKWAVPWCAEEATYVSAPSGEKKEVGIEYRRGCWTPRKHAKHAPLPTHSVSHGLCGPDVEARLPQMWRELADKLQAGFGALTWGRDMPLDAVVVVQTGAGHPASPPADGMLAGCSAASPSASVIVTAPSEEDFEKAKSTASAVLGRVMGELRLDALFVPSSLSMPQQRQKGRGLAAGMGAPPVGRALRGEDDRDGAVSSSSSSSSDAEAESEEVMSDAEPTETYRPLRLNRVGIRDAYLQGLLCLNCDAADHKHQDCPFRKKVCWNCHANHSGNECPHRCRFCKDRHDYPLLECVKKVCRRVNDWKKSKPAQEQRGVLSSFEQLMIKLEGFEDLDLAKHNREVQVLIKGLSEQGAIFPGDMNDLAMSVMDMKPAVKDKVEPVIPPPPAGPPPKPYVAPKIPKEVPPMMPENKHPWSEKIFLDELLSRGMYGANIMSRIIGRGGAHHRRMEQESGARVFFRGLGVSGRDADLSEPIDCRLHISVKGEVPQQARRVRAIVKEIVAELDKEIAESGETGPLLDKPRDPDAHQFGFLIPKGTGPENEEPLKFRFPEEDGQTLNDLLVWLKQAKLPLELDSDTQWRTTLQVTPSEPPLPDDAPEEAEAVAEALDKLIGQWQSPSPYWFEETDLRPTGIWSSLTTNEIGEGAGPILLQQGQGVRLSASACEHFASILEQTELQHVARAKMVAVLARLRGVVRRAAEDDQLLLYLSYPWAFFAESTSRGLKLPFSREQVHRMLIDLGRVGGHPTETNPAPPFRGFFVEWMPVKAGAEGAKKAYVPPVQAGTMAALPGPAPTAPAVQAAVAPQFAAAPQQWPQAAAAAAPPSAPAPGGGSGAPRGFCKYWLPEAVFGSGQDLRELIAGPGGAHFGHVLKKYPSVDLRIEGQPSLAAPPAHRIHLSMSTEVSEIFENAAADVLDLVETVCDMVGEELGMSEDQVEGLIQEIRAEKYFEAHGIRTPLPPTKRAEPAEPAPAPAPVQPVAPSQAAPSAAPTAAPSSAAQDPARDTADFEFIDEDMEAGEGGGAGGDSDTEDDARTEAPDLLSDVTDNEDGVGREPFGTMVPIVLGGYLSDIIRVSATQGLDLITKGDLFPTGKGSIHKTFVRSLGAVSRATASGSILTRMALNGNRIGDDHIDHAIARLAVAFKTYNYLRVQRENHGLPTTTCHYTRLQPDGEDHPNSANEIRVPLHKQDSYRNNAAACWARLFREHRGSVSIEDRVEDRGTCLQALGRRAVRLDLCPSVEVERVADFLAQGDMVVRLDVRTAAEFAGGSVPSAVNIPVDELPRRLGELPQGAPIAVFCAAGVRSGMAKGFLEAHGFQVENCVNVQVTAAALNMLESE
ncbi:unnamed protein product [Prorocentrum cordatum]|uniref:Rhodanese domain-containing protein n=1 Tax=Prorocentrum cordatum TaxID=2364126 RepID=A0ABN9TXI8_9DINO|nr:unnamed protein product [Polarella glacialis]